MKGKAKVLITFDDGLSTHYDAAGALTERGLRGAFGVVSARIGEPGFMNQEQLSGLESYGHFICSHSRDHLWLGRTADKTGKTISSRREVTADLVAGKKDLTELGFDGDFLILTYGTENAEGSNHLRELLGYFRWIRLTRGSPVPNEPYNWLELGFRRIYPGDYRGRMVGISAVGDSVHPGEVRRVLIDAHDVGGLAVVAYHHVTSVTGSGQDITWKQFMTDLNFMKAMKDDGALECVLPRDVL